MLSVNWGQWLILSTEILTSKGLGLSWSCYLSRVAATAAAVGVCVREEGDKERGKVGRRERSQKRMERRKGRRQERRIDREREGESLLYV